MNTMKKIMKVAAVVAVAQSLTGCFTLMVHEDAPAALPVAGAADWVLFPIEATWFLCGGANL